MRQSQFVLTPTYNGRWPLWKQLGSLDPRPFESQSSMPPKPSVDEIIYAMRFVDWSLISSTGPRCARWRGLWRAFVQRGDVYELRSPHKNEHEQGDKRYGDVVQSDAMLPRSVVLVASTSKCALPDSYRPQIPLNSEITRVLFEQLGAVDVNRLVPAFVTSVRRRGGALTTV